MSSFENYSNIVKNYDQTRKPVGIHIILGCLACHGKKGLREQTILDAGCGTGNYLKAIGRKTGKVIGLDKNASMLEKAKEKVLGKNKFEFFEGDVQQLPFKDGSFDAILCNQVLHHLDLETDKDGNDPLFQIAQSVFNKIGSEGWFIINTCSKSQVKDGFWWTQLIPEATQKLIQKLPDFEIFTKTLKKAGFKKVSKIVPLDETLQGDAYFDPEGPLKESYRQGDSTWTLASAEELKEAQNSIINMQKNHKLEEFLKASDKKRQEIGQTTFICAHKY